jgi:alkylation response protein AidB-like acyl-CoA dehydrogenase
MSTESAAARLLTYRAAWAKDESAGEFSCFAAMSKLFAARAARIHSAEAVQIFGAAGVSDEEPVEKMYRDAKVLEICEGTSEIQKNIIAREVKTQPR